MSKKKEKKEEIKYCFKIDKTLFQNDVHFSVIFMISVSEFSDINAYVL